MSVAWECHREFKVGISIKTVVSLSGSVAAAGEFGIDAGGIPIRAVENTEAVRNVILCSCYPRLLIGLPPDWYKACAYRSRVVREPRTLLQEFGTQIPDDMEVRVHDSMIGTAVHKSV